MAAQAHALSFGTQAAKSMATANFLEVRSMLRARTIAAAACLGIALAALAFADQWDKKTVLTVGQSIQVPGKVLPPGKYVMKLFNSLGNRNVVQIFNEDETEVLATILAIPNYRLKPADETHFTYWETSSGKPAPLK